MSQAFVPSFIGICRGWFLRSCAHRSTGVLVKGTNCSREQFSNVNVKTGKGTATGMLKQYMRMSWGFSESPLFVSFRATL